MKIKTEIYEKQGKDKHNSEANEQTSVHLDFDLFMWTAGLN